MKPTGKAAVRRLSVKKSEKAQNLKMIKVSKKDVVSFKGVKKKF